MGQLQQRHDSRSEQQAITLGATSSAPFEVLLKPLTVKLVELAVNVRREQFSYAPAQAHAAKLSACAHD
jgi:hypothetical protein